jgi:hypothetical protein
LLSTITQNCNAIRNAFDRKLGEFVHSIALQFREDNVGLFDKPLILLIFSLPGVENQDHTGVEGLLAHCPGYEHSRVATSEEQERMEEGDARVDHQRAAAQRSRVQRLIGVVVDHGMCHVVRYTLVRAERRSHVGRRRVVAGWALCALDSLAIQEYQEGLNFGEKSYLELA